MPWHDIGAKDSPLFDDKEFYSDAYIDVTSNFHKVKLEQDEEASHEPAK